MKRLSPAPQLGPSSDAHTSYYSESLVRESWFPPRSSLEELHGDANWGECGALRPGALLPRPPVRYSSQCPLQSPGFPPQSTSLPRPHFSEALGGPEEPLVLPCTGEDLRVRRRRGTGGSESSRASGLVGRKATEDFLGSSSGYSSEDDYVGRRCFLPPEQIRGCWEASGRLGGGPRGAGDRAACGRHSAPPMPGPGCAPAWPAVAPGALGCDCPSLVCPPHPTSLWQPKANILAFRPIPALSCGAHTWWVLSHSEWCACQTPAPSSEQQLEGWLVRRGMQTGSCQKKQNVKELPFHSLLHTGPAWGCGDVKEGG